MKTNRHVSQRSAFTLIEMVGVLAVIAILAALLVPKIFQAINDSRFSSTVESVNNVKTACMDYFGKVGSFPLTTTNGSFDHTMISSNCLEKPFMAKIAPDGACVQVVSGTGNGGTAYKLDGTTATTATGNIVVECVLTNVAVADAWELSKRLDGDSLSAADAASADAKGRVCYTMTSGNGLVYVYLAHK